MPQVNGDGKRREPDLLGVILLGLLALGATGGAVLLVEQQEFTASGLLLALVIGGAFLFAQGAAHRPALPKNTLVHGSARPASEHETEAAARGLQTPKPAHEEKYPD